ncbi:transglycosylase SLT domain-containing protein [Caproiciproducens sp. CPB-2]|uniref:transglycosylase SLT domain-containing protein n=1 Tax=Caproiciproducens sp. CPB-2 TaxID=3030017 RepID=UPI0023DC9AA1|nr:transglycosylase SLT domain-containing protein [Caproiciproducens sp. CPB-2]MDF1495021.1 transglycosylase SLT domain-containing protein [Caproiciproducens sp. CPB-2]
MKTPGKIHCRIETIYALCMIAAIFCIGRSFHNQTLPVETHIVTQSSSSQSQLSQSSSQASGEAVSEETSWQEQNSTAEKPESKAEKTTELQEPKPQEKTEQIQSSKYYDIPLDADIQDAIFRECKTKNVPEDLVIALIGVESHYNSKSISKTNDYGLMQINICHRESLERDLQVTDLLDSKQNIKAGVHMLSWIVNKYSNMNQALMVYNNGEAGAQKLWKQGVYSTPYSRKVIDQMNKIKKEA